MKYRALKDFVGYNGHFFKAGELVDYSDVDPHYVPLQNLIASLLKFGFIEEIKDEPWEPEYEHLYSYVSDSGLFRQSVWVDCTEDRNRFDLGNCFENNIQAAKWCKWLKTFKVLRDDTKGFKPDWKDCLYKYTVVCDYQAKNELLVRVNSYEQESIIYFATEADAKESIKKHRSEWLTFFRMEESK